MQKSTGNTEEQLVTYVQQIEGQSLGWQAVHLHLSRLAQANRKEYNIRIALNGLNDLIKQREGRIFLLDNQDVIVMLKGAQVSEVKESIFQTKFLFQEDPLTKRRRPAAPRECRARFSAQLAQVVRPIVAPIADKA